MHAPSALSGVRAATRAAGSRRWLHSTRAALAITTMRMPAMSPTMKEGGIASWKVKEGGSFAAGDVLLEIETDKATIDVEAQEDGVLGKIILPDGAKNVPVGKAIAILAEDGDDISNLEVPKDEAPAPPPSESKSESAPPPPSESKPTQASGSSPASVSEPKAHGRHPKHKRPLFPSVLRLLVEHDVSDADIAKIKGTGVRGMLTKGDVLTHLGQASGPLGSSKVSKKEGAAPTSAEPKKEQPKPLDGFAVRQLIVNHLVAASQPKPAAAPASFDFDSILDDYLPRQSASASAPTGTYSKQLTPPPPKSAATNYFAGLL